ncbi:VOC family protein [Spirillospora sp. NPDC048819]|uniref:VOC family protein n=1 Tax=Spirillospora sp. NPDC048819 TaxID=3155268 RepID=UPI0033DF2E25
MPIDLDTMAVYAIEYGLHVRDAEASLRFYRDTLGMEPFAEIFVPGAHVWGLRLGNSMLKLLKDDTPPESQNPRERSIGFRYITIHALNIAELVAECAAAGYEVMTPPSRFNPRRPGDPECEYAFVRDPDGNTVELSQGSPWVPPTDEFIAGTIPTR